MNRKTTKKVDESTLTTLCAVCRGAFLDAKGVRLRRADPRQLVKDVCTYCQTRYGFDYYVQPIVRKSKMTGKENRRETEPAYQRNLQTQGTPEARLAAEPINKAPRSTYVFLR